MSEVAAGVVGTENEFAMHPGAVQLLLSTQPSKSRNTTGGVHCAKFAALCASQFVRNCGG